MADRTTRRAAFLALLALSAFLNSLAAEENMEAIDARLRRTDRPAAPALAGASAWINVDKPPALEDLKGKIVLLDFWTFG